MRRSRKNNNNRIGKTDYFFHKTIGTKELDANTRLVI